MRGQNEFTVDENTKLKIKVINDLCISAATCIIRGPKTFDLDDDGIAYVKEGTLDDAVDIIEAAKSCPTTAIIIEDMNGKTLWPEA
ncbi:ferredoxin [candidate division WWE3 bacterium]|jgi:ferredoxin|nr:ferredoxin [candidate division WWE3 bacterium]MBT7349471.1 ferredoxin [candidate division WWE3 bacterium]